ncbi:MAG: glycosyltransferase family 2 protein [Bacteroidia bacterium]|nr:glycosyltransferase family 2 protein [Bacteroidia bacterium]
MKLVSVVVPTYRGAQSLPILVGRLHAFFIAHNINYELIIVNDASPDNTKEVLKELKSHYGKITAINLMKNYGQHNAILCGFKYAKGDVVITMDDDLQNPPEEIGKLLDGISKGFDLVIGAYDSKKHSKFRNISGDLVDRVQRFIFNLPNNFQLTSFRAIRRNLIDNINSMSVPYPYVTSMLLSHTVNYLNVPVRHEKRLYGKSNYKLKNSIFLILNLVLNYSSIPIYIIAFTLFLSITFVLGFAIYVITSILFFDGFIKGWPSMMLLVSFLNMLVMIALMIFGLYLARIYQLTMKAKNSYVISEIYE